MYYMGHHANFSFSVLFLFYLPDQMSRVLVYPDRPEKY